MPEIRTDAARKPIETKTGLKYLGYKTRRELARLIEIDGLTGLLNRTGWDSRVSWYSKLSARTGQKVSFIALDLDDLKKTNDTNGHKAGDKLLKDFAIILKKAARDTDVVARYGGDEFAICLPDTGLESANILKNRLLDMCGETRVSVGVGVDFSSADEDMYRMKKISKNG